MENKKEKESKNEKKIKLKLIDLTTTKQFYQYFDTEFERKQFIRKLRFSKKIKVIHEIDNVGWED